MKKLNLGCGIDYKEGFVNVDFHSHIKIDVEQDLNLLPSSFQDGEFDYTPATHVLEHLDKPFGIMQEMHRILKPGGELHIKVPPFSRGFTHSGHKAGFDVTFPYYFNPKFTKSGYYGVGFELKKMELHYFAFFHLLPYKGVSNFSISIMKVINGIISFFANLSPMACSRL